MDNVMTVPVQKKRLLALNRRTRTLVMLAASASLLVAITAIGALTPETSYQADFAVKYQSPSWPHPFGTDYMGRDMLARTLAGLSTSVLVGLLAATVSAVMAVILGIAAATLGRKADNLVSMAVNLMTGGSPYYPPHADLLRMRAGGKGSHHRRGPDPLAQSHPHHPGRGHAAALRPIRAASR